MILNYTCALLDDMRKISAQVKIPICMDILLSKVRILPCDTSLEEPRRDDLNELLLCHISSVNFVIFERSCFELKPILSIRHLVKHNPGN